MFMCSNATPHAQDPLQVVHVRRERANRANKDTLRARTQGASGRPQQKQVNTLLGQRCSR